MSVYCYPRPKRGLALIVRNSLRDSKTDILNLRQMFTAIEFETEEKVSSPKIYGHLETKDLSNYNVFFLVVLSDIQTRGKICALSRDNLQIERLVESMAKNSSMFGQPKLALFGSNVYGGAPEDQPQGTHIYSSSSAKSMNDVFLLNVVLNSYNTDDASVFIDVLCRRVQESFREKPFINIVQEVAKVAQLTLWSLIYSTDKVLFLTQEGPASFHCDFCEMECSGIWQHLKCKKCVDVFVCWPCKNKAALSHHHSMWTIGEQYDGNTRAEAIVRGTRKDFEDHLNATSPEELKLLSVESDLLLRAVEKFGLEILPFMMDKSFDINGQNSEGKSLLHRAGNQVSVQLLLSLGADVNVVDNQGRTPLHLASMQGQLEVVRLLGGRTADLNQKDKQGDTPLILAMREKHFHVKEFLLHLGADINCRSAFGETLQQIALQDGDKHPGAKKRPRESGSRLEFKQPKKVRKTIRMNRDSSTSRPLKKDPTETSWDNWHLIEEDFNIRIKALSRNLLNE